MDGTSAPVLSDADKLRIVIGVLIAMMLAALDQTIVAPALPTIGAALGDVGYLSWVISAYFLTSTAVTPLYGKIADIRGRRPTLFAAVGIFLAGSVLCALAPSMPVLIAGRAIQGIGGGGLIALAQTVIGDVAPPKERARYVAYITGVWATSSIAGPVFGGLFAQHLHWSLIFWINLPLGIFAVVMTNKTLQLLPQVRREHRLDLPGAALIVLATMALMLALTWGGGAYAWTSPVILGLLGGAVVLSAVLGWHLLTSRAPLIPLTVLRNSIVFNATLAVFFAMAGNIGISAYLPIYLEFHHGLTSAQSGLALVPYLAATVIGANTSGRFMARIVNYKRLATGGLGFALAMLLLLAWRAPHAGFIETEILLFLMGLGFGMQFPITMVSVQNAVEPHDLGIATATLAFLRSLGSAIGVAVLGAIVLSGGIVQSIGEARVASSAPLDPATALRAGEVFQHVFLAAALALVVGWLLLLRMPQKPLRGRAPEPAAVTE